mgnify:CR=1 FL=1
MKLPTEFREFLVIALDDYLEMENDDPNAVTLAATVVRLLGQAAEDSDFEEADNILADIEEEAELEEPLIGVLEYEFAKNDEMELTGEDITRVVERVLGLKWSDDGMDEASLDTYEEEDEEVDGY